MSDMLHRSEVNIGEVLHDAAAFDWNQKNADGFMASADIPAWVEAFLNLLLERKTSWVLVGGLAMLQHVPGRNTKDIDIIVAKEALDSLPELEVLGRFDEFIKCRFKGIRIDLLLSKNKLFAFVRDRHCEPREFAGHQILCATPEGLALLKLYAMPSLYRQFDFDRANLYEGDVTALTHHHNLKLDKLLQTLRRFMPGSDINALKGVVHDIKQRIRRIVESQDNKSSQ